MSLTQRSISTQPTVWDRTTLIAHDFDPEEAEVMLRGSYHTTLDGAPALIADDLERGTLDAGVSMEVTP